MAGHAHSSPSLSGAQTRALVVALGLNAGYFVVEIVGGLVWGSLALLADGVHMLSDVTALGIALFAQHLASLPATVRHTYGLKRAEVLGAMVNGLVLIAAAGWILIEGFARAANPEPIQGPGVLAVAAVGLAINLGSASVLARAKGDSLNMRGAYLHMLSDAAGSVAVMASGVAAITMEAYWVDAAASIAIAGLILWAAIRLLADTVHVLMEGSPRGLDAAVVEAAIASHDGVESIHHLHLWNVASDMPALSAHIVLQGEVSLHEAQVRGDSIKEMLATRFGIEHATLELECHDCEVDGRAGEAIHPR